MDIHQIARHLLLGLVPMCCMGGGPALASDTPDVHPFLTSKFSLELGLFASNQKTTLQVDGSAGNEHGEIEFDENLGFLTKHDIFAAEFVWRFGKKWSARMQSFEADRRESAVLEQDIEWGDQIYLAGSSVTLGSDFNLTRAFFARSFDSSPKHDYGLGVGIHFLETGGFIEYDILTTLGETSLVRASGPLPNIGTWYYYSPSEKWYVGGRLDWFSASVGDYSGGITNAAVGANYRLFDHIGVGLKYQYFGLNADVDNSNWHGGIKMEYDGWFVFLSGHWK